jgi:Cu+-exporting ATPase
MHREISHTDELFGSKRDLTLYLLTGLLGLLLVLDLWPALVSWLGAGSWLPTWPRELFGYRYALIAAVVGGARTLYGSLEGLLEGRVGADLALALAAIAAILIGEPLVAAEVVFIGMLGEVLESFTFARTQHAIRKIVEVCPRRCWLLRDGQEVRVRTTELQVGDRVVVKPGARIPVDGVVLDGRSALDVSALTGESLPVDRGPGDEVLAGSLNQFGALTVEAKRVAEQTVVGRVIELTARALKDKAPLERTADRLARYFLPVVLGLAALTFLVTFAYDWSYWRSSEGLRLGFVEAVRWAVYPTLAVLVVACPCALILATPAAVIAALGRLAGTGVLIKGGSALERLAGVTAFAFDKTGTLTEGRLELGDVVGLNGVAADEVLAAAAAAEQRSEHLLARLISHEAAARQLPLAPVQDFLAHPGAGVTARVATPHPPAPPLPQRGGERQEGVPASSPVFLPPLPSVGEGGGGVRGASALVVGTRRLLEEQGIALSPEAVAVLDRLDASGQTTLLVARDGVVLGVIGARDRVRPEAAGVLEALRALGIGDLALLTGDRATAARSVAEALGITDVHAELLPDQKAAFVASAKKWAFVGDGINDAPALARAQVGLAIGGTGTDVAAEAGDIVFMGDPLRSLPLLVRLARETVRVIRQNILIFAFGVNIAGVVLTAWLWPLLFPRWYEQSPLAAVVYHQLGSLAVLLNAMRLLWFERTKSSPTWLRLRHAARSVDHWLEHHANLDEGLHWLSHRWKPVAAGVLVVLGGLYLLSGCTIIGPDEVGVVRRFGRALEPDLTPGLHWCWPWPVEQVTRLQRDRIHTVEIGFRTVPGKQAAAASLSWSSAHGDDGIQRFPEEAVMITGDGNLVEVQAVVRYTVSRPHVYLFEVRDPDEVLRGTAEGVLREMIAARTFELVLTSERGRFQEEVLTQLRDRCDRYGPAKEGLGIELESVSLLDLHPPQEVVEAYYNVTRAMEARDKTITDAEADALRTERTAHSDAVQIVQRAEAARNEVIREAEAAQAVFLARQRARTHLSLEQEVALLGAAAEDLLAGKTAAEAYQRYDRRRRDRLALQVALTDFRLFWDSLGQALAGRDKLIVDADKVPGRRHLLLFDPSQFAIPVPMLPLPSQQPDRSAPSGEGH